MLEIDKIKKELARLKLVPEDLKEQGLEPIYSLVMEKLLKGSGLALRSQEPSWDNFIDLGLGLLGLASDQPKERAEELGIYTRGADLNLDEFLRSLYSLLLLKNNLGEDLFDQLCIRGVFADYNQGKEIPEILYFNGKTRPIFDYQAAIFEKVYVEAPLDSDGDGERDLIATYIRRPYESQLGMQVPSIYVASPYMMGGDDDNYILHNVERQVPYFKETNIDYADIAYRPDPARQLPAKREIESEASPSPIEEEIQFDSISDWYKYFLCRGYAIVLAGGIGTRGSQGLRSCGSVEETISTIAVVDWLNNRLAAFTDLDGKTGTQAHWSNGNVGMTGKSYLGTLANAAATTGVAGLKTVVPEAAISNWYNYYRSNGVLAAAYEWQGDDADLLAQYCFSRSFDKEEDWAIEAFKARRETLIAQEDRISGNYNRFWDERNYLNQAENIGCSVFLVHGLNDFNVKPRQFYDLWKKLEGLNIESRLLLHQGGHIYLNDHLNFDYSSLMNKWFDHYLYEIDNQILDQLPKVIIQSNLDRDSFNTYQAWPEKDIEPTSYYAGQGLLSTTSPDQAKFTINNDLGEFKGDPNLWRKSLLESEAAPTSYSSKYLSQALDKDLRISGPVKLKLRSSQDRNTGILSAMLVDYGRTSRVSTQVEEIEGLARELGIGAGTLTYKQFKTKETDYKLITRGTCNIQNRRNDYNKDQVLVGQEYDLEINMEPTDYSLLKGHRLGLIIYSTDLDMTERPIDISNFQIHEASIELIMQVTEK